MGGSGDTQRRPPHQRRVARDHDSGMVGDAAPRGARRVLRLVLFQALAEPIHRDRVESGPYSIYRLILLVVGIFVLMYLGLGYVRLSLG